MSLHRLHSDITSGGEVAAAIVLHRVIVANSRSNGEAAIHPSSPTHTTLYDRSIGTIPTRKTLIYGRRKEKNCNTRIQAEYTHPTHFFNHSLADWAYFWITSFSKVSMHTGLKQRKREHIGSGRMILLRCVYPRSACDPIVYSFVQESGTELIALEHTQNHPLPSAPLYPLARMFHQCTSALNKPTNYFCLSHEGEGLRTPL